ncbi:MAG: glutaminase A [Chromatiaceae bacterium]|nr:glutaminase A [Gammaproteobacteria bacterium]MCP5300869.1 glutaminase A [Chromatiaceae bacterium]MCP5421658.1 glutaminase A [Chromatiaceae bacterium]
MDANAARLSPVQRYLDQLHAELAGMTSGEVASYIPELLDVDPDWLGIALVTVDGNVYQVGDSRQGFTIQSISKALTYGLALEDRGLDYVKDHVGVEPSGEAFNSISLEPGTGRPLNPMINAGAIATTGMIESGPAVGTMDRILETFSRYSGHPMSINDKVYRSESETGHRNRAIAHLLYGHGILDRAPEEVLDLYFRQCSIVVSARDLAMMGACLANNGVNPITGVVALQSRYVPRLLSVMSTCGMYDYSGSWIFQVGMPAKSGVGGGILAVLPGQFGLGVFSPRLDEKGNSVRGIEACRRLSGDFGLNLFQVARSTSASVVRQIYDSAKFPSRRRRGAAELDLLAVHGHKLRVYELQGELLFGSAEAVALDMLAAFSEVEYLVVDLKRVVGADRSSVIQLREVGLRAMEQGKQLFVTDCQHLYQLRKSLQSHADADPGPHWLRFDDTDHALEWCEDDLLAAFAVDAAVDAPASELDDHYLCHGMSTEELATVRRVGVQRQFVAGTRIFRAGDAAGSLYFIFNGEVEVSIDADSGRRLRLTTLGPGCVFGEVALLNGQPRSADVHAIVDTQCLEVAFDDLQGEVRNKVMINLARYFAQKIQRDTGLVQHLG